MKQVLFLLVSVMAISVSAKKIDFAGAIEQSHQERTQTAEQIQEYLEVSKSHITDRKPQAEAKKNLFRGATESIQLVADVK